MARPCVGYAPSVPARETLECKTPASPHGCTSQVSAANESRPSQDAAWCADSCGVATLPRIGWTPHPLPHQVQVDELAGALPTACVRSHPRPPASAPLTFLTRSPLACSVRARQSCAAEPCGRSSTITRGDPLGRVRTPSPAYTCLRPCWLAGAAAHGTVAVRPACMRSHFAASQKRLLAVTLVKRSQLTLVSCVAGHDTGAWAQTGARCRSSSGRRRTPARRRCRSRRCGGNPVSATVQTPHASWRSISS